jgi:glycosyltransferase involved in cell wall biosynthesis
VRIILLAPLVAPIVDREVGLDALLTPVRWDEPMGMTAIEAPAAGCPVVAIARGGLREVVEDGRSGCLVESDRVDDVVEATEEAVALDRAGCRESIERRFGIAAMVRGYLSLYARALEGARYAATRPSSVGRSNGLVTKRS